ncbi:MAG: LemA family protein [Rhodothermales bacterium]
MRSKGTITLIVVALLVLFAGCAGCNTYNSMIAAEEQVEQSWADVETQYQRRADLIPNLVNTVRGAADFEQETLESVTQARANATSINLTVDDLNDPAQVRAFQQAQSRLTGALSRLLAVSENYPQLRATEAFRDLQAQLEGTENRINVARTRYNEAVRSYNTQVRSFPNNLFASVFGFGTRTPFEAEAGAEDAPTVDFSS